MRRVLKWAGGRAECAWQKPDHGASKVSAGGLLENAEEDEI